MAQPIWKDYYFTIPLASAPFRVRLNSSSGSVIYAGKATARPNESTCRVKVNDICAAYIAHSLPVFGQPFASSGYTLTFYVEYQSGSTWTAAGTVTFDWDWSYDNGRGASVYNAPVRNVVDARQWLPVATGSTGASITATYKRTTGSSTYTAAVTIRRVTAFETDKAQPYAIFETAPTPGIAALKISTLTNPKIVTLGGLTFDVDASGCHRYCLYYLNAYGAWDALLLQGRVSESDAFTRHRIDAAYDNTDSRARSAYHYADEIRKTITMHTGWLSDDEASRMYHLLGSTHVFLHDLAEDVIVPLLITNGDDPHKSYSGEGNQLVDYTITAELAHEMIRR